MHCFLVNKSVNLWFCIIYCLWFNFSNAQETKKLLLFDNAPSYNKSRVNIAGYTTTGLYAVSMAGLYQLWYKDYELEGFHFFNDNNEWLQIDKGGHIINTYWSGKMGYDVCRWAGMSNKKSTWMGGNLGYVFLASIEVFDGFSSGWGFSTGDIVANTIGAATFISQQLIWQEQRIEWKISFHPSPYAKYRPDEFGNGFVQQVFKDYNGHTFWLSANISSFLLQSSSFPKWLNVSLGYGADGLTGGSANVSEYKGKPIPSFRRTRQYYIAPDINLARIKTRSKFLHFVLGATRFIKFPLPALEYNDKGKWVFHALYF